MSLEGNEKLGGRAARAPAWKEERPTRAQGGEHSYGFGASAKCLCCPDRPSHRAFQGRRAQGSVLSLLPRALALPRTLH